MNNPKISFVLPTHNRIEWVGEAVTSILGQTEKDLELIIIDDGSTDGTKEFLENWLSNNNRVRIFRNEQSIGCGPSRHFGAMQAKADIISVMDDDDVCLDDRAEKTLSWFNANKDSELVNFPYVSVGYNNEVIKGYEGEKFNHDEYISSGRVNYFCNPSVSMKKDSYLKTGGYLKENSKETDDSQFVRNWIKAGKKIDFCPGDPVLLHRVLPNSMMVGLRGFDAAWVQK